MPQTCANKTGFNIMKEHFNIRRKLHIIKQINDFSVLLRTSSNPEDINRFQSHTGNTHPALLLSWDAKYEYYQRKWDSLHMGKFIQNQTETIICCNAKPEAKIVCIYICLLMPRSIYLSLFVVIKVHLYLYSALKHFFTREVW